MPAKFQKGLMVRLTLLLVISTSTLGVKPAQANSGPNAGFLNSDGTMKLEGNTLASFQAEERNGPLDAKGDPTFSPANRAAFYLPLDRQCQPDGGRRDGQNCRTDLGELHHPGGWSGHARLCGDQQRTGSGVQHQRDGPDRQRARLSWTELHGLE
jgi:hypothetical protein